MTQCYTPLPDRSIRLMQFLDDTGLRVRLATYPLARTPRYAALSYTWEKLSRKKIRKEAPQFFIRLNGRGKAVHENLYDALKHLVKIMHGTGTDFLWADYLCINQADKKEVEQQMWMMKDIFEGSSNVFAWLGLPSSSDNISSAIDLMSFWHADYGKENGVYQTIQKRCYGNMEQRADDIDNSNNLDWEAGITGIIELFNRPYWRRTWVLPEITTPTPIVYLCGFGMFSKEVLAISIEYFQLLESFHPGSTRFTPLARTIFGTSAQNLVVQRLQHGSIPFLSVLGALRRTECTDPRDKVFAAVSLASDINTGQMAVDYEKPLHTVYSDVVRFALETPHITLDILSMVHRPFVNRSQTMLLDSFEPAMPTWVPDWRFRLNLPKLWRYDREKKPVFTPCPGSKMKASIDGLLLEVEGILLSNTSIKHYTSTWQQRSPTFETGREWYREMDDWNEPTLDDKTIFRCFLVEVKQDDPVSQVSAFPLDDPSYSRGHILDWELASKKDNELDMKERTARDSMNHDVHITCCGRRMGFTSDGRLGLFPGAAQIGDVVAILHGAHVLHLVRPVFGSESFEFVGECYVHGLMNGEAMRDGFRPNTEPQVFKFI